MKLYELLKAKIGEREAEAFIEILENIVETRLNKKQQFGLPTKILISSILE